MAEEHPKAEATKSEITGEGEVAVKEE